MRLPVAQSQNTPQSARFLRSSAQKLNHFALSLFFSASCLYFSAS